MRPGNCTTAQVNAGTCRFDLGRNLIDAGLRDETFSRDTIRVVGGLRGTFNDDWTYEVSANYGRFEESTVINGFYDRQRFVLAMDAGRNPVTGQIQCRSQFDPASAVVFDGAPYGGGTRTNPTQAARLAADIAACIPYNPFGAGSANAASVDYFTRQVTNEGWIEQFVLSGFLSGDTSDWFELLGRPDPLRDRRRNIAGRTSSSITTILPSRVSSRPPARPTPMPWSAPCSLLLPSK